jgi:hypothetical protein
METDGSADSGGDAASGSGSSAGSGDDADSGDATDSADADTGTDGTTGPGGCNDLDATDAAVVDKRLVALDAPDPVGGVIPEGTWERRDWVEYTGLGGESGPGTNSVQELLRFSGDAFDVTGNSWRWSYTFSTDGVDLMTDPVCGDMGYPGTTFSVLGADQLVIYGPAVGGGTFAMTYLRLP